MKKTFVLTAAAAFGLTGTAMGVAHEAFLGGLTSYDFQGAAINDSVSLVFNIGDLITDVDFDVNMTGEGVSWFEEATYTLWDGSLGGTLIADGSGGALSYSVGSQTSFFVGSAAAGNHNIADYVMTTTTLVVELHEWNFDDNPGAADAHYNSGSQLTINFVPAPAGLALLGIAGLIGRRRRR